MRERFPSDSVVPDRRQFAIDLTTDRRLIVGKMPGSGGRLPVVSRIARGELKDGRLALGDAVRLHIQGIWQSMTTGDALGLDCYAFSSRR